MCTEVKTDLPTRLGTDVFLSYPEYFLKQQKGPLRFLFKVAMLCRLALAAEWGDRRVTSGESRKFFTQVGKQP